MEETEWWIILQIAIDSQEYVFIQLSLKPPLNPYLATSFGPKIEPSSRHYTRIQEEKFYIPLGQRPALFT
jgi:hypothetical protein